MYNAIQKYGWDNIKHEVIHENLTAKEAKKLEKYYITEVYHSNDKQFGYNMTSGGDGLVGYHHSEKSKQKISNASKMMWNNKDFREKMSGKHAGKNNGNYGKTLSEEHRKIISDYAKQRTGDKNHFYGKSHSEESKKKISENRKGKASGKNNHNSKKVLCIETGECFESASIAAKTYGMTTGNITSVCRGKSHTAGGYHWQYII